MPKKKYDTDKRTVEEIRKGARSYMVEDIYSLAVRQELIAKMGESSANSLMPLTDKDYEESYSHGTQFDARALEVAELSFGMINRTRFEMGDDFLKPGSPDQYEVRVEANFNHILDTIPIGVTKPVKLIEEKNEQPENKFRVRLPRRRNRSRSR